MLHGKEVRSGDDSISIYWTGSRISVASGVFALITILGVIPRMTDRFGLASRTYPMETVIMLGGTAGNLLLIYEPHIPFGVVFLAVIGLFSGVYIGCLSMALAEVLKVIPILCTRTKLQHGIAIIITAMAIGKCLGTLYQMCL